MKGLFVSFEGGDGAGKSTLMHALHQHLLEEGKTVLVTRAPGGTPFGEKVRSLLLHEKGPLNSRSELFLFLADRAEHITSVIRPALEDGKIILCDRFNDSTIAYQGAARELEPAFVRSLCLFATENVEPDLTFYLDIDPRIGIARASKRSQEKDRMEQEGLEFHEKIRAAFLALAKKEPHRIHLLDATKSPEALLQQATQVLHALFLSHRQ